jgi:alpha-tubulin suppressor-like RCC1 family protein
MSDLPGEVMRVRRPRTLSVGQSHTFIVTESGVFCWGCNDEMQLGISATEAALPVPFALPLNRPIKSVTCATHHTVAIEESGRVWCWGWNKHGELGRSMPHMSKEPLPVEGLPPASTAACGQAHTLVLGLHDPIIFSWGSNVYGELGREGSYLPEAVVVSDEVLEDDPPAQLAACGFSSGMCTKVPSHFPRCHPRRAPPADSCARD